LQGALLDRGYPGLKPWAELLSPFRGEIPAHSLAKDGEPADAVASETRPCQRKTRSRANPVNLRRRFREAGVSLVELSISLFLLMAIAIFGLQTMMSAWLTQNWSIVQSMTDAYAGIETAYAQRWTFANIPTSNRWPVYPASGSTVVFIGKTPKGPVNATVVRTSHQNTDPLTGAQSYMLESYVLYQDHLRQYCKVSKVYRTQ
jgi:hypothetical protein